MTGGTEVLAQTIPVGRVLEVACDESGSDGENLIGGNTDVFAHAGVHLTPEAAALAIQETRERIRSPAVEYKANHLLREKHRPVLEWLLGPAGPISGHAQVHLTDKAFFLVVRVVELFLGESGRVTGDGLCREPEVLALAKVLYDEGRRSLGHERWHGFLVSANSLMRTSNREDVTEPVDAFFRKADELCPAGTGGGTGEIIERFRRARPRAETFRRHTIDHPGLFPPLDPLIPAIVGTVGHWTRGGAAVALVHDQQNTLTEEIVDWLKAESAAPHGPFAPGLAPTGRLTGLRLVSSRSDARVQLADFLAGVARKIASDELRHEGDARLTALLRPYVDPFSLWGDDRSWSLLGSTAPAGGRVPAPH